MSLYKIKKIADFIPGIVSAASFGLIPLFAKPLLDSNFDRSSVLSYRLLIAALFIFAISMFKKVSLRVNFKEIIFLLSIGLLYYFSASLLFISYTYIDTGLSTVLHFLYPVFVTLIMVFLFKHSVSIITIISIILSISGVFFMCFSNDISQVSFDPKGLIIVICSALAYGIYIVMVNQSKMLREMNNMKLTFYVFIFGGALFLTESIVNNGGVNRLSSFSEYANAISLALIATLLSNIMLMKSIKLIGSTRTSVLGAMESITAVVVGVFIFNENFTFRMLIGMIVILVSITLIVISPLLGGRKKS